MGFEYIVTVWIANVTYEIIKITYNKVKPHVYVVRYSVPLIQRVVAFVRHRK